MIFLLFMSHMRRVHDEIIHVFCHPIIFCLFLLYRRLFLLYRHQFLQCRCFSFTNLYKSSMCVFFFLPFSLCCLWSVGRTSRTSSSLMSALEEEVNAPDSDTLFSYHLLVGTLYSISAHPLAISNSPQEENLSGYF